MTRHLSALDVFGNTYVRGLCVVYLLCVRCEMSGESFARFDVILQQRFFPNVAPVQSSPECTLDALLFRRSNVSSHFRLF